jgi:mxaK protein
MDVKRRHVQTGFASAALLFFVLSAGQWFQLRQQRSANQALRDVPAMLSPQEFADSAGGEETSLPREVQFARATALLHGGNLELAEKYLADMIRDDADQPLAVAAQFNLANGYLREALISDVATGRYRSLVELSKQRYRDLLDSQPDHWSARYNLELALRMVPEQDTYEIDDRGKPIKSVSVVFPGFEDRELP